VANFSSTIPYGLSAYVPINAEPEIEPRIEIETETESELPPAPEVQAEVVSDRALARRSYETTILVERVALERKIDPRLIMLLDPSSASGRSYRLLRHRLLTSGNPRVIAVTSATPGEGKTTCAVNLALAIAEDTLGSVLLLDANGRRPALGKLFRLESLENSAGLERSTGYFSVVEIDTTRLHVATAVPGDGGARLDRCAFGELLHDLRRSYDHIVVDAASVLESADTDVAAEFCDGVIVAARAKHSRRAAVGRALDELRPATIFGVVLIDT
jgi:Mrp family chromosome partitioning ATPase